MIHDEEIRRCRKLLKSFYLISRIEYIEDDYKRLVKEQKQSIKSELTRLNPSMSYIEAIQKELSLNQEKIEMLETLTVFKETIENIQNLYQKSTLL